ncbi:hypothetical protein I543_5169 [Mycobacteroides abscessus 21]|uniref:Uncharacterized protein n=1 Tax=Mycobacteroides abscessus 21 TaxID=1299324 RepID=A0A829Q8C4_9MYCO|nr:hypothetical protein I543_5169 [Mycobacteroides abscessus 21]
MGLASIALTSHSTEWSYRPTTAWQSHTKNTVSHADPKATRQPYFIKHD